MKNHNYRLPSRRRSARDLPTLALMAMRPGTDPIAYRAVLEILG